MTDQPADTQPQEANPDDGSFLRARFAGGRFDAHAIPFDVLPDLAAYRNLIIDVAKFLFKQRHNNRVRVPKRFAESFQIALVEVKGGQSAVAIARRQMPDQHAAQAQPDLGFDAHQEFDEARDYVDQLLRDIGLSGNVPTTFPTELAGRFNPFGQNLRDNEYIELSHGAAPPVRYDTFIRKKIVLSREKTYENMVNGIFTLNGGLVHSGMIHVLNDAGVSFDFRPLAGSDFEKAMERWPQRVRLTGTGLYDRNETLRRLLDVNIIYDDDEPTQPFHERLTEIARTEDGWYEAGNPAPTHAAVDAMRQFVSLATQEVGVPAPYLYPLPDGGVAAEWTLSEWEISAEIRRDGGTVRLHAINTSSSNETCVELVIEDADAIAGFSDFWGRLVVEGDSDNASG